MPVSALTSNDFRFKARVWFLRSARTTCVGCATGCSSFTDVDTRNQHVYRYRENDAGWLRYARCRRGRRPAVNKYWMCDEGMLDYQRIHEDYLRSPDRLAQIEQGQVVLVRVLGAQQDRRLLRRAA